MGWVVGHGAFIDACALKPFEVFELFARLYKPDDVLAGSR